MRIITGLLLLGSLMCMGCNDVSGPITVAANPYERPSVPLGYSSPAPGPWPVGASQASQSQGSPNRPSPKSSTSPEKRSFSSSPRSTVPRSTVSQPKPPPVQDEGEHALQLSLSDYSEMARQTTAMLQELTDIHILVDESGDAEPYQERWGELTADLTRLHREVMKSGYPSPEIADPLTKSSLPRLQKAIDEAAEAVSNHTGVESGIKICQTQAKEIYEHLEQVRSAP